ncbi:MAG: cation transporter [Bryobacterales bacterium]|nr:cation transporter [Bryobacterales bacterium]
MKIEVLYLEGCPNHATAVNRIRQVLREEGVEAEVVGVDVRDEDGANRVGFLGSPTVRVNGIDVEPSARSSRDCGPMCRTYVAGQKREGAPPKELIRAALLEALAAHPAVPNCCEVSTNWRKEPYASSQRPSAFVAGSIVAAALASFCCILPIVFALTGLTVVGAAAAFAAWRPYLLAATFALLGLGFSFAYRTPKEECAQGSICAVPASRRRVRTTLWLAATLVFGLAAFPYFSGPVAKFLLSGGAPRSDSPKPATSRFKTASLSIEGMDCSACATAIQNKLNTVRGVRHASVSFERRAAEIEFDPGLASVDQLEKVVEEAGYRVRSKT